PANAESNQPSHRGPAQRRHHPTAQPKLPGAQYRRLRTHLGAPKAITAMARKLACLFFRLIKHGEQYVDKWNEYYESRYREQQIRSLTKRAQRLGLELVIPTAM